jgi:hypothetical protein
MTCIYFRDSPDDVFADGNSFEDKDAAAAWFNPQYKAFKESGATVTTIKEWPESGDVSPVYWGTYIKGYRVERKGEKDIWILITEE